LYGSDDHTSAMPAILEIRSYLPTVRVCNASEECSRASKAIQYDNHARDCPLAFSVQTHTHASKRLHMDGAGVISVRSPFLRSLSRPFTYESNISPRIYQSDLSVISFFFLLLMGRTHHPWLACRFASPAHRFLKARQTNALTSVVRHDTIDDNRGQLSTDNLGYTGE
jgi:hypothetical protein